MCFNLRRIADEIFGANFFVGEIYWESKTKSQNTSTSFDKLQPKAETILVYAKKEKYRFNLIKKGEKEYPLSDEQGVYREYPLEVMNANGIRGRESMCQTLSIYVSSYTNKNRYLAIFLLLVAKKNFRCFLDLYIQNNRGIKCK